MNSFKKFIPCRPFLKKVQRLILDNKIANAIVAKGSKSQLHDFWENINDEDNGPIAYVDSLGRSKLLLDFVEKYLPDKNSTILEIGCNVGRNLNYLSKNGYNDLSAIEISQKAINEMENFFPSLKTKINIHLGPAEDIVGGLQKDKYDCVFTMAVLEHIHTSSEFLFSEMKRIAKDYVITIENEKAVDWRHFPRNYKNVFEALGMKQLEEYNIPADKDFCPNYWVRVFKKI